MIDFEIEPKQDSIAFSKAKVSTIVSGFVMLRFQVTKLDIVKLPSLILKSLLSLSLKLKDGK